MEGPDGALAVDLELEDGKLYYSIFLNDRVALERSPLGVETSIGSFSMDLSAAGTTVARIDERYRLPHGKVSDVHYLANELTARYVNVNGDSIEVIFRVSETDVAFAYRIASEKSLRLSVLREVTGFNLPSSATAFVTQQAKAGTGWMGTKPSYEEGYAIDAPVSTRSHTGLGFTFPALFRLGEDGWVLISETGVSSLYAGTRLTDPTADGVYTIALPEKDENGGVGESTVVASLPLLTPWRTLTIGSTLAPIVESTIATDVVEPLYEASMEYKPGRATWSWLLWQDPSMNEADQRLFIDMAEALNFEYILIDALWEGNLGREKLAELVAYANSKGVDALLWYNSNGYWNDAPQGPRNRLDRAPARRAEMAWLQSIGVKGLKVDFFGGDKQVTMKLYEDLLTDANAYGLHLNFHGATLPRGWERMYPNFMTSEAVTASENLVFSQGFADAEAFNSTVFPFVRNPVAAMDYGPMVLNKRFSKSPDSGNFRRTTDAFQLATSVLYFSPVQHFGLAPNNLEEQPAFVLNFLKAVPSSWDEVRYLSGYPGKYVVLARRSGSRWYVAATSSEKEARRVVLDVPFLAGRSLTMIYDSADGSAATRDLIVDAEGRIEIVLEEGGGVVLFQ